LGGFGSGLNMLVPDVDKVYSSLIKKGLDIDGPPADHPYGMRDFTLIGPSKNRLTFGNLT